MNTLCQRQNVPEFDHLFRIQMMDQLKKYIKQKNIYFFFFFLIPSGRGGRCQASTKDSTRWNVHQRQLSRRRKSSLLVGGLS